MEADDSAGIHLAPTGEFRQGFHGGVEEGTGRIVVPRTGEGPVVIPMVLRILLFRLDGTVVEHISPFLNLTLFCRHDVVTCTVAVDEVAFFEPDISVTADEIHDSCDITVLEIGPAVGSGIVREVGILITDEGYILHDGSVALVVEGCSSSGTSCTCIVEAVLQFQILGIEVGCRLKQMEGCCFSETFFLRLVPDGDSSLALSDERDIVTFQGIRLLIYILASYMVFSIRNEDVESVVARLCVGCGDGSIDISIFCYHIVKGLVLVFTCLRLDMEGKGEIR